MQGSPGPTDTIGAAQRAAARAAERSGVTLVEIHDLAGEAAVSALFDRVWGAGDHPVVPSNLLRAITHAGNYLAGAYDDDRLVGGTFGFLGRNDDGVFLHSHMTGVDPTSQREGIGFALKLHQRAWALSHGLRTVQWTFDPLVRHNSYFNLVKLGAEIVEYRVNFYGDMPDGINAGDESDRVVVSWDVASERVDQACNRGLPEPDVETLLAAGAEVALDVDENDRPVVAGDPGAPLLLCHIPEDIVALRRRDPRIGAEWRHALRRTLGRALRNGRRARAITRSGWYLLSREDRG
jgi:predicted GNAT superfamily acetyltransferase